MVRFACVASLCFSAAFTCAQEKSPEPGRPLYAALQMEAKKHFDARRMEIAKLKTPADVRKRQEALRAKLLESFGGFPEKTPLNAKTTGTLQGDGFRVENVVYESRPQHHVTGNLYVPNGKGPFPGVIIPCGHSANGKAAEAYQRASILLAKHKFVALCYDPIGQGERSQLLDRDGKPSIASSTNEHTLVGIGAWLVGQSTATYRIWDGIRSLDYLASRPEVDAKKLGCTGNSGGGTLTAYLMAIDDRIAVAAPSCYITSLERLFATIGPQDAEQNIVGQVAFGLEHSDFALLRAPRPTLFAVATRDFFDIDGAWTAFREASKCYTILGHSERMSLFEFDDTHGFSKPRREAALRWMRRWLQGIDDAPTEAAFPVFKDAELQCTRSGQVLEDYKGISAYQLSAKHAAEWGTQRAKFRERTSEQQRAEVRRVLRLPEPTKSEPWTRPTEVVDRLKLHTEIGLDLDAVWIQGDGKGDEIVVSVEGGPLADAEGSPRTLRWRKEKKDVVLLAPRGLGRPNVGKPRYFSYDFGEAMLSLHLDRPLLGQRVGELLSLLERLPADSKIHLAARGKCGPIALHAAALSDRVATLNLVEALVSWENVTRTPASVDQVANVVPGVLKSYDLPDLFAMLGSRETTVTAPTDAAGKHLSREDAERFYEPLRKRGAKLTVETP